MFTPCRSVTLWYDDKLLDFGKGHPVTYTHDCHLHYKSWQPAAQEISEYSDFKQQFAQFVNHKTKWKFIHTYKWKLIRYRFICNCLFLFPATATKEALLRTVQPHVSHGSNKVTVVGVGQVGMACAFSIMSQVIIFYIHTRITWY